MEKKLRNSGFTLIEALVALFVLSIGLLGVAAMQLKAMQSSHLAYHRSVATLAAQDAVERLWAAASFRRGACSDMESLDEWDVNGEWSGWHVTWAQHLPELTDIEPGILPNLSADKCRFDISIEWKDERFSMGGDTGNVSSLKYLVKIPAIPGEE